jgi:hypothetical protein
MQGKTIGEFPYHVMTGAAGQFADIYAGCIEAPPQFLFMAYLTLLGSVISPALTIKSVLRTQPRLFILLVGESATERKSTTLNHAAKLFKSVLGEEFVSCWGVGSAEGLERVLRKRSSRDQRPLGTVLIFDEFKGFVSKCSIESSVLLPTVNTLFESNHFESHTKKLSIKIEEAHLSLLAATTVATYERIYTNSFLDIGFPNRVFIVTGTAAKSHAIPAQLDCRDEDVMREGLLSVLRHVAGRLVLDFTPEARQRYEAWYLALEDSIHSKRLDTYSLRLAMLLAVNDLKAEIDLEAVEGALALCDWQLEVRRFHDPIEAESKSAAMEEKLRRCLVAGPMNDRDLRKRANAHRVGLWFYDSGIKALQRSGEIAWDRESKAWRLRS